MKLNLVLATIFLVTLSSICNLALCQQHPTEQGDSKSSIGFKLEKNLPGKIIAIELSNDGKVLAAGGLDKSVTLHSTEDFSVLATTEAPVGLILDLMYSSDGKYLVSCGDLKQVLVMDASDLSVKFDYRLRFRPERATESADGEFIAGGRSGQLVTLGFTEKLEKYLSAHKSFVGGLCSSSTFETTYSAGDQADGPYFLSRKAKKLQKIVSLPGRPSRVTAGSNDEEVLVVTANHAMRVDVFKNKTIDQWHLPEAKKVEDIVYWAQRDLYVTSDKAGFIKIWQRGNQDPVASHRVSKFDVYQVVPLDDNRIAICGRAAPPSSMSIWRLDFDETKFPKQELVPKKPDPENLASSASKTETPKTVNAETASAQIPATSTPETASQTQPNAEHSTSTVPKPSPWLRLNDDYEVKRINPAELNLRSGLPSTKGQQELKVSELKEANQPIPESLKNFEPLEINSAIVSTGGKLFLATTDGLVQYNLDGETSLIKDNSSNPIYAACVARDPVDGIIIGLKDQNRVLELRESGKLISRGQLDPELESEDKKKLSVSHVAAAGSDYLALSNNAVYRRYPEGSWEKVPLHSDNPITRFSLLDTREIVTSDANTTDLKSHPCSGVARKIQASRNEGHASNASNVLVNSASNMKVKKLVPLEDGNCFCVFARIRTPTGRPLKENPFNDTNSVTACGCTLSGSFFDSLVTSHDFDWGVEGLPKKDRTVVDLYPGPSGEAKDVWFLTPKGVGLLTGKKTEFWRSQFKLERKKAELSRIEGLGDGSFIVFTTDGVHGEDVFLIRPVE